MNFPLPEVAFSGEQELLIAPDDLLELFPLTGDTVLHFELSEASIPGTDTSMVRFPSSAHALRGDSTGDTGDEERFKPTSFCCSISWSSLLRASMLCRFNSAIRSSMLLGVKD